MAFVRLQSDISRYTSRILLFLLLPVIGCMPSTAGLGQGTDNKAAKDLIQSDDERPKEDIHLETITLGGGCFWCVEAVFLNVKGVKSVVSGYSGGHVENPTYEQVCSKLTGHAEVCRIEFDPEIVSLEKLLEIFWKTHDPTTPNRQGNDVGPQYRSVIFFESDLQKEVATELKERLDKSGAFDNPIVTQIQPLDNFYEAEDYHQNFYARNPTRGYCQAVIRPKLETFRKVFQEYLDEKGK